MIEEVNRRNRRRIEDVGGIQRAPRPRRGYGRYDPLGPAPPARPVHPLDQRLESDPWPEVMQQLDQQLRLERLTIRSRRVVRAYLAGHTFEQIGRELGLTKQGARAIYRAATKRLRRTT